MHISGNIHVNAHDGGANQKQHKKSLSFAQTCHFVIKMQILASQ